MTTREWSVGAVERWSRSSGLGVRPGIPAVARSLVAAALLVAGCAGGTGAPEIRLDRAACARCGMLVSELASAAAYRTASGEVRTYDDIGCLLADLAEGVGHDVESSAIWVYDRTGGKPLRASEAAFVRSPALHTPMSGGLAAFADAGAAAAFAAQSGGETVDFARLRASAETREPEETE